MEAISSIHKSSSIQKRTRKRKRSSHFEVKEEQQRRNKILILEKLKPINDYLKEFGKLRFFTFLYNTQQKHKLDV